MTFEFIGPSIVIMILSAILAMPIGHIQIGQVTEIKLFKNEKGKVAPASIAVSPNLAHFSYSTLEHKIMIDGKAYGPYLSNGAVVYSGNSDDFAFLAGQTVGKPSSFFYDGVDKSGEFPVSNVFRAGDSGGLCWIEHKLTVAPDPRDPNKEIKRELSRLAYPGGATDWFERIEKMNFSDDGSLFALRVSEKVTVEPGVKLDLEAPTSHDYIIHQDGSKVLRENILQVFPAPDGQGYASLSSENSVTFRNKVTKFKGEFYGKPQFSPDGKQFVFRNSFTGTTSGGRNVPFYQYNINGFSIPDLQIQTGLTFAPDGKKWVMCGLNGKDPFIYVSSQGMVPYADFPGLGGAPPEPYKEARFANGKIVLLFQPKRAKPMLFVEDKGIFELGDLTSVPETLSISPDGRTLVLGCTDFKEMRAFAVNLESPGPAVEILKKGYDLQDMRKGTFVWKSDHQVQFLILRNSDLIRVSATF